MMPSYYRLIAFSFLLFGSTSCMVAAQITPAPSPNPYPTISPEFCGDGVCNFEEYCDTCPADCGSCDLLATATCPDGYSQSGLAAALGDRLFFSMEVQAGDTVNCKTSQGTGDVDLYMRFESSEVSYDCSSTSYSNNEECTSTTTEDGTLLVILQPFLDFSNVDLVCICENCGDGTCTGGEFCYSCPTDCGDCEFVGSCPDGFSESELSAESGSSVSFNMEVNAGDFVRCATSPSSLGTSGDSDLSLRFEGSLDPVCTRFSVTSSEECEAVAAVDGVLVIAVNAYSTFTGVNLNCTCGSTPPPTLYPTTPPAVCGDGNCDSYPVEYCDTCQTDCGSCNLMGTCPDGFTSNGLEAFTGERLFFSIYILSGETVRCNTFSNATMGDADLGLRFEDDLSYSCLSELISSNEECATTASVDSVLIVEVGAYSSYSNLQLVCTCETAPVSPPPSPAPTSRPTSEPTSTPTLVPAERVGAELEGVTVTFEQSRAIQSDAEIVFEDIVSTWFDAFYNGRRRRSLQGLSGIRNMKSHISVKKQSAYGMRNVVTFTQSLNYDAFVGSSQSVKELVLAPWMDEGYNAELGKMLAMELPGSFKDVQTPITGVTVVEDPESPKIDDKENASIDTSSPSAALYALSALAVIPLAAVIGYAVYRRRRAQGEGGELRAKDDVANEQTSARASNRPQSADHLRTVGPHDETHDETDVVTIGSSMVALIEQVQLQAAASDGRRQAADEIEQASAGGSSSLQSTDPPTVGSGNGPYNPSVKDQCRSVLAETTEVESRRSDPPPDP